MHQATQKKTKSETIMAFFHLIRHKDKLITAFVPLSEIEPVQLS